MFKFTKAHLKRPFRPVEKRGFRRAKTPIAVFFALSLLTLFSCKQKSTPASPVIARVDDAMLTLDDLKNSLPADPGLELSRVQIERFVQRWIESELLYTEALRLGVHKRTDVQSRIKDLAKEYVAASYVQQYAETNIEATDEEIRAFYQENSSEFIYGEDRYHICVLLVNSMREAASIRSSLQLGQDFATVAKMQSLDGSKDVGGDLGWVVANSLLPSISRAVPSIPVGQVSQPIRTDLGYYLVQVLETRKKGDVQTIDEVKEIIALRIKAKKKQEEYRKLIAELTEKANVRTDWSSLQALVADSTLQ